MKYIFYLQHDGSQKFDIPTPRLGFVVIQSPLDFEELNSIGQTYYILNISATVSLECSQTCIKRSTLGQRKRWSFKTGDLLKEVQFMQNFLRHTTLRSKNKE